MYFKANSVTGKWYSKATVLFERGGVYRGGLVTQQKYVNYGAYGTGDKPQIIGSAQNYAELTWTQSDIANVWQVNTGLTGNTNDVADIIYNDGEVSGRKLKGTETLSLEYDFYHDNTTGIVYVYCSQGNPAELYSSIEMSKGGNGITIPYGATDIKIDNLAVKYFGEHGISLADKSDGVQITNCEVGFIGGYWVTRSETGGDVRYGNGIQIWNNATDITVSNCWVYECYDAGITNQSDSVVTQSNITISDNLIEYCAYNIEFFTVEGSTIENVNYTDNIVRFAGYGHFDPLWRHGYDPDTTDEYASPDYYWGSDYSRVALVTLWAGTHSDGITFSGNIFDTSFNHIIGGTLTDTMPTFTENSYLVMANPNADITVDLWGDGTEVFFSASSQADLEENVAAIDTAPGAITYITNVQGAE